MDEEVLCVCVCVCVCVKKDAGMKHIVRLPSPVYQPYLVCWHAISLQLFFIFLFL